MLLSKNAVERSYRKVKYGRFDEDYRPDKVMQGPAGNVILALGIVITILGIIGVAQLPDAWLSHLFGTPD